MRKRTLVGLAAGLLIVGLLQGTPSQERRPELEPSERLLEQLSGVNVSMDRLVQLLQAHLANQDVELVLKRIELRQSRLAPLEREVRAAEEEVFNSKAELKQVQQMREQWEELLRDQVRDGLESDAESTRNMLAEAEQVILTRTTRLEELQRRAIRLEDELAEGREELAILDERLQQLLDERE